MAKSLFQDLQGGQDFSKMQQQRATIKATKKAAAMRAKGRTTDKAIA